jgi:hypothetical protein
MGSAFLALWNGIDRTGSRAEYEAWHAFEHVPERVGLPGFAYGRRYAGEDGYFTLYGLQSLAALDSPAYADVIANPTPWSERMRPRLSAFVRRPCLLQAQAGSSWGAALTTVMATTADPEAWSLLAAQALEQAVQQGRLLRAMAGVVPAERSLHYPVGGERIAAPVAGETTVVFLAEHIEEEACASGARWWAERMQALHLDAPRKAWFRLQSHVERAQLPAPAAGRRAPLPDLMARYAI